MSVLHSDRLPGSWQRSVTAIGALFLALAGVADLDAQQVGTITGEVTTEAGQPLPGVQVVIVGTQRGTLTNASGAFLLANVPAGPQAVEVRALGYRSQTQTVNVAAGSSASV